MYVIIYNEEGKKMKQKKENLNPEAKKGNRMKTNTIRFLKRRISIESTNRDYWKKYVNRVCRVCGVSEIDRAALISFVNTYLSC